MVLAAEDVHLAGAVLGGSDGDVVVPIAVDVARIGHGEPEPVDGARDGERRRRRVARRRSEVDVDLSLQEVADYQVRQTILAEAAIGRAQITRAIDRVTNRVR